MPSPTIIRSFIPTSGFQWLITAVIVFGVIYYIWDRGKREHGTEH